MAGEDEGRQAGFADLYAQFLAQFADQGRLGPFAGLDLAAGKLSQAGQRLPLGSFGDKHPSVDVDQGDGDDEDGGERRLGHDR